MYNIITIDANCVFTGVLQLYVMDQLSRISTALSIRLIVRQGESSSALAEAWPAEHEVEGSSPPSSSFDLQAGIYLNLVLVFRDLFGFSKEALALPPECYQRPHVHGLIRAFRQR